MGSQWIGISTGNFKFNRYLFIYFNYLKLIVFQLNEESVPNQKNVSNNFSSKTTQSTSATVATSSMTKIHHSNSSNNNQNNTLERSKTNGGFPNTTMKQDSPHSVLLMDAFNPPSNADIHGMFFQF